MTPATAGCRTGDLGEIDDEGFVRVTGRKKEILVTAGGKNVAPSGLEDQVRSHPLVSQCLVVGDGQPFIAALVTLDLDAVRPWAEAHGKSADLRVLVDDPDLRAEVQSAVDEANRTVSQAESIRRFTVLPVDWTEESGLLTPSLKLKRALVMSEFRREVGELYESLDRPGRKPNSHPRMDHPDYFAHSRDARGPRVEPLTSGRIRSTWENDRLGVSRAWVGASRSHLSTRGKTRMGRRTVLLIVAALIAALGTGMVFLYVRGADNRAEASQAAGPGPQGRDPDQRRARRWRRRRPPARSRSAPCPGPRCWPAR